MAFRIAYVLVVFLGVVPAAAQSAQRPAAAPSAQPFRYTPEEQEACLPDAQKLCDIRQQPAVVLACLRQKWDAMGDECRAVLIKHGEGPNK